MTNRWNKFSAETEQRLFDAIDEDDVADEHVGLPAVIDLQCTEENIRANYGLCLQYWEDGFTRTELLRLVLKQLRNGGLSKQERMQYKYIRSRYKHLRFALRLYSKKHESRMWFSKTTVFLGRYQDAFRNKKQENVSFYGKLLRVYLSLPVWVLVRYSLRHIQLDSVKSFIAYRQQEMRNLQALIAKPLLTGREFHDVRKIVSQQVSYYDTLRSIDPGNQEAFQVSRFLAAINGIMGDKHDEMVADDLAGVKAYSEPTALEPSLRERLELLLARYPL
ncbi:hypothetical protein F9C28_12475 [Shimwellia pseudoproteus]|uniref:hypothetical protein n=1 Tax=Shimwellia pseudoproteus TaxID=570012 RepID=UPI0018EB2544|nr:hypothetical protein [Shimwellia pseudoproteus]MBJ3815720.1 hypothetical protein [Shimwellia pseudoproteus]